MKQPSVYLKMRVLGAVDPVEGRPRHERVHHVAAMTFLDEEGNRRQFTWRTIQTWYYRYKNHGITGMTNRSRSDKGQARKVTPEELLEAVNAARSHFHTKRTNKRAIYHFCIEKGLLHAERIAPTTFYRFTRVQPAGSRRSRRQETVRLQHEIRQPTLAGRHHVRPLSGLRGMPQTGPADRLYRRCQPRPVPRRVLLRGKPRHPCAGHPRRLLQTR